MRPCVDQRPFADYPIVQLLTMEASVLFYAIRPCNDLDTIVANGRKQTVLHLFLDAALKTVAYLRVSTRSQDLANQKLAILEFSQKRRFPIDQFIESRISSRQSPLSAASRSCWRRSSRATACWSASCRGSAAASLR